MKYYPPLNSTDPNAGYENADEVTGKFENCLPDARGFEATQREIVNVVTSSGLTPSDNDLTQLSQAIGKLAGDKDLYSNDSIKNTIIASGLTFDEKDKSQLKTAVETTAEAKAAYATKSIENAVIGAGLTPAAEDQTQLKQAIEKYTSAESERIMLVMDKADKLLESKIGEKIGQTELDNLKQALAPMPQVAEGVGQWIKITGTTLPAGGTWAYIMLWDNHAGSTDWCDWNAGIAAGGTNLTRGGVAWRIQ